MKKMSKLIWALASALLVAFCVMTVVSCDDADGETDVGMNFIYDDEIPSGPRFDVKTTFKQPGESEDGQVGQEVIFETNGSCTYKMGGDTNLSGTYSKDNSGKITTTFSMEEQSISFTFFISGTFLWEIGKDLETLQDLTDGSGCSFVRTGDNLIVY